MGEEDDVLWVEVESGEGEVAEEVIGRWFAGGRVLEPFKPGEMCSSERNSFDKPWLLFTHGRLRR